MLFTENNDGGVVVVIIFTENNVGGAIGKENRVSPSTLRMKL